MKPAAEWTTKCTWCLHSGKDSHPDPKGTPLCYLRKYPGRPRDHPWATQRVGSVSPEQRSILRFNTIFIAPDTSLPKSACRWLMPRTHSTNLKGSNTVALRTSKCYFNIYHHLPRVINALPQNNLFLYTNDEASLHSTVENSSIL